MSRKPKHEAPSGEGVFEPWPGRRATQGLLAIILLIAFVLRLIYVLQIRDNPLFADPVMDPAYHTAWARALAEGESFQAGAFFRAPLYPWFLGLCFKLFGESFLGVRLIQALFGTATTALVFLIGSRTFDRRTGLLASIFAATYWVLIYFDAELLIPTLAIPLNLLALWIGLGLTDSPTPRRAAAAGAVFGLAAIARPNVLLVLPFLALWLFWSQRPHPASALRPLAAALLGLALPILPISTYNTFAGKDLVLISSQGGVNLWIGNNPDSDGVSAVVPGTPQDWWGGYYAAIAQAEAAEGRELKPSEVSRHYAGRALSFWTSDSVEALKLLSWKLRLFFTDLEFSNNQPVRFFAHQFGPITKILPLGFGALVSLGMLGLLVSARSTRAAPLAIFFLVYAASVIAFFVCARFRLPVLPILMVYAAHGSLWWARTLRAARWAPLIGSSLLALCVLAVAEAVPDSKTRGWFRRGRIDTSDAAGHFMLGTHAYRRSDYAAAAAHFQRALAERPKDLYARRELGNALARLGRSAEAETSFQEALTIDAKDLKTLEYLANFYLDTKRLEPARGVARRLIEIDSTYAPGHYLMGRVHGEASEIDQALSSFQRGLELGEVFNCGFAIGSIRSMQGRPAEAAAAFRQALTARTRPDPEGWFWRAQLGLGKALIDSGQRAEAQRIARELTSRYPTDPGATQLARQAN